jgi:hypothetical protein
MSRQEAAMKKYIATMIAIVALCCAGTAFAGGGGRGGSHHGGHHGSHHTSWYVGIYASPVAVVTPVYRTYYYPPVYCRYIDVYDEWGNYLGQERICD